MTTWDSFQAHKVAFFDICESMQYTTLTKEK